MGDVNYPPGLLRRSPLRDRSGGLVFLQQVAYLLRSLLRMYPGYRLPRYTEGEGHPPVSVVYGVLVVCGACLAAVAGLVLVQRLVPVTIRKEHNDVAGFIYAVLGVIYAVLLALVVIATWEEFGRARVTVEAEANALAEIFWLAHRLPEPEGRELQELCRSYAEEVVNVGWSLMEEGEAPLMTQTQETSRAWVLIDDIRASLQ